MGKDKPSSPKVHHFDYARRRRVTWLLTVAGLCCFFYLLGDWQNGGAISSSLALNKASISVADCVSSTLDFGAHHGSPSTNKDGTEVRQFPPCDMKYSEYTPCEDPIRGLNFPREMLAYRERHCPGKNELLKCLIPAPPGYKNPIPWPQSRDYAWYANTPHKELTVEKAIQKWVQFQGEKLYFPGGGTFSTGGAEKYIEDIAALIPINDGTIRTAIDTGCGVASWGAYLLQKDILAMSFAPRDTHVSQIQFALERGVPAILGIMAVHRMPYPARAFDMAHCSRCLIPWGGHDNLYLIEVDRVLRPGGYWILSGPPINWKNHYKGWERTEESLKEEQDTIEDAARRLCWKKVKEEGNLAIWQKPWNHIECVKYHKKNTQVLPHVCSKAEDPDHAWYRKMETCITPLPDAKDKTDVAGGGPLAKWPARLTAIPPRISSGSLPGINAETFIQDTKAWVKRLTYYKVHLIPPLAHGRYRNIMDMNAGLGGFAAALIKEPVWVMNAMPPEAKDNTLGVIYERGLIGTYQNWCEAFSTYPRTYDLIHANGLFSMYQDRCDIVDILLEMDRILRPEGAVLMRDEVDVLTKVMGTTQGMRWECRLADHEDGPFNSEKILVCVKTYWVGEYAPSNSTTSD
ncbi:hypothetical protein CY35_14G046300 [Sphagnum magellanicum]|nr:hypothetical protein CY35_14G046300 [Sphagnum magellanicum]